MRAGDEQGDEKVQERNQEVTCQYDNGLAIRQRRQIQAKEASLIQTLRIRRLCLIKKNCGTDNDDWLKDSQNDRCRI